MTSSQTHPLPNQPQELGSDKDVPGSTMNAAAQAQSSDRPPNSQPMASYGLLQISVTVNAYKTYQPPSTRSLPREPRKASGPVKRRKRRRNLTGLVTLLLTMLFGVFAILQWYQGTNSSNGDTIEKDHLLNLFMACQARPNDTSKICRSMANATLDDVLGHDFSITERPSHSSSLTTSIIQGPTSSSLTGADSTLSTKSASTPLPNLPATPSELGSLVSNLSSYQSRIPTPSAAPIHSSPWKGPSYQGAHAASSHLRFVPTWREWSGNCWVNATVSGGHIYDYIGGHPMIFARWTYPKLLSIRQELPGFVEDCMRSETALSIESRPCCFSPASFPGVCPVHRVPFYF